MDSALAWVPSNTNLPSVMYEWSVVKKNEEQTHRQILRPSQKWHPVLTLSVSAQSVYSLSCFILVPLSFHPGRPHPFSFNLLGKWKMVWGGRHSSLYVSMLLKPTVCFYNGCFDHMQVTFTVCWHWLLRQAVHISVCASAKRKKHKRKQRKCSYSQQLQLWTGATLLSFLINRKKEEGGGLKEMDLRFWEIHKLGPYLIVQSQYVLVNKWTLQVEQRKGSENHKEGADNKHWLYQRKPENSHDI